MARPDDNCRDLPSRWFFEDAWSDMRQQPWPDGEERARRICCACPNQEVCLGEALLRKEEFGVWGGSNPRDRRRLWRQGVRTGADAMVALGFREEPLNSILAAV